MIDRIAKDYVARLQLSDIDVLQFMAKAIGEGQRDIVKKISKKGNSLKVELKNGETYVVVFKSLKSGMVVNVDGDKLSYDWAVYPADVAFEIGKLIRGKRSAGLPIPVIDPKLKVRLKVIDDDGRWKTVGEVSADAKSVLSFVKKHKLDGVWVFSGGKKDYFTVRDLSRKKNIFFGSKVARELVSGPNLPKSVRVWYEQFKKEGYPEKKALKDAIQRAYESDAISESVADRLEKRFRVGTRYGDDLTITDTINSKLKGLATDMRGVNVAIQRMKDKDAKASLSKAYGRLEDSLDALKTVLDKATLKLS